MSYEVVEQLCLGKSGDASSGDDGVYLGEGLCAVIDGVSSDSRCGCCGRSAGQLAVEATRDGLTSLPPREDLARFLSLVHESVLRISSTHQIDPDVIGASAVVWNDHRRELWFVGDCQAMVGGETFRFTKEIDSAAAVVRSAILRARLTEGATVDELSSDDTGRKAITPLLDSQRALRNDPLGGGDLSYPLVSSTLVPVDLCRVAHVPLGVGEVVLASDGYPELLPTLEESEARLEELLEQDPLCIGPLRGTKGVHPDNVSFDDRTFLRIHVDSTPEA